MNITQRLKIGFSVLICCALVMITLESTWLGQARDIIQADANDSPLDAKDSPIDAKDSPIDAKDSRNLVAFHDFMQFFLSEHTNGHLKKHICPCCGFQSDHFDTHNGRENAKCPKCQAFERHRRVCAILGAGSQRAGRGEWFSNRKATPFRLVHFGPQVQMEELLHLPNVDQVSLDYFVEGYTYSGNVMHGDVTNIPLPTGFASGIMIYHVLEHIADVDRSLKELIRILSPGGWLLIEVPCRRNLTGGVHKDCRGNMSKEERHMCAGQWDHQWQFDCDFFEDKNLVEAGLDCYRIDGSDPSDLGIFQPLASYFLNSKGAPLFSCTAN